VASYQYNVNTSANLLDATVFINMSVFVTGLSGPPVALHIHGFSAVGQQADVIVPLCGPPLSTSCSLPTGNTQGSLNQMGLYQRSFTIPSPMLVFFASLGSAYINIHTDLNPMGEVRGQLGLIRPLPPIASVLAVTPPFTPPNPTPGPTPAPTAAPGGGPNAQADGGNAALSGGAVAGIVIGSIVGVAVLALASWVGYKRFQATRPRGELVSNSV
jgi:hypothetical protein